MTSDATGRACELLEGVEKRLGMAPSVVRTMAHSPAIPLRRSRDLVGPGT